MWQFSVTSLARATFPRRTASKSPRQILGLRITEQRNTTGQSLSSQGVVRAFASAAQWCQRESKSVRFCEINLRNFMEVVWSTNPFKNGFWEVISMTSHRRDQSAVPSRGDR